MIINSATARAILLAALLLPSYTLAQPSSFSPDQRQAIGEIVREYLLKNPEVLQEAIAELERRNEERQKALQIETLRSERGKLLNSAIDYVAGNPQGDVTLVEFLDYNCPYCKKAMADVKALIAADPKLRVVLKDFPVLGPDSVEASQVALAARQQLKPERLLEYHTKLMEIRGRVNGERARAVAREMGLDMARLEKDVAAPGIKAALEENVTLGDKLDVTGTPAFIVGDEMIAGAVGAEPLKEVIANTRKCGKARC